MTPPSNAGGDATSGLGASPAAVTALMRMNSQIDISGILPAVRVPTLVIHRTGDKTVNVEGGRDVAAHIPGARLVELPGSDHIFYVGDNADEISDAIEEFLTGSRAPVPVDRVLATVLFTDIVGSTEKAAALGDQRWRDLLDNHHATIRRNLARFRGHEVKTTGDGFLATFDGPARGVRCACAIAEEIKSLGIEVRAGPSYRRMRNHRRRCRRHCRSHRRTRRGACRCRRGSGFEHREGSGGRLGIALRRPGHPSLKGIPGEWRIFTAAV